MERIPTLSTYGSDFEDLSELSPRALSPLHVHSHGGSWFRRTLRGLRTSMADVTAASRETLNRHPVIFCGGLFAAGLVAARLLQSSSQTARPANDLARDALPDDFLRVDVVEAYVL